MTAADDDRAMARYADELADAIEEVLVDWVERSVRGACAAAGVPVDDALAGATGVAARRCHDEVSTTMRALLRTDVDEQRTTPLALLRAAVRFPTTVLVDAGVPVPERDEFARRSFPHDLYALSPASFGDVDPRLHEPGLVWGAAKAHVHLTRRRAEGLR